MYVLGKILVFRHRLSFGRAAAMPSPNSHDSDDEGGSGGDGGGGSPAKRIISLVGHGPGYKDQMREAAGGGAGMRNEDVSAGEVRGAGAASGLDNRGPRYKDQMREAGVGETAAHSDDSLSLVDNKNRGTTNELAAVGPAASVGLPVAVPIGQSVILEEQQEERLLEAERRAQEAERQRVEAEQVLQQSQQRNKKKRACYLLAVLALLGAAAAAVAGVCGSSGNNCRSRPNNDSGTTRAPTTASPTEAATPTPSKAPTPLSEEARSVLEYINSITLTGRNLTYPDQESPEGLALQWLIDKDKIGGTTSDLSLLWLRQRYVLFTLLYQGDNVVNNLFGRGHSVRLECEWEHVTCDGSFEGVVESLDFNGSNAQGRIPDDIGLLTSLTYLDFSGTRMAGTIPSSLERLTALTDVRLYNSQFDGIVPFCSDNSVNQTFVSLAADCDEVDCPCCTHCCPGSDGDIPAIPSNWSIQCGA
jgi:hypothetical protein